MYFMSNDLASHRTSLAINALVNTLHESIECNNSILGIFIDLSRAFDTLSHEILCNRLNHYGIRMDEGLLVKEETICNTCI